MAIIRAMAEVAAVSAARRSRSRPLPSLVETSFGLKLRSPRIDRPFADALAANCRIERIRVFFTSGDSDPDNLARSPGAQKCQLQTSQQIWKPEGSTESRGSLGVNGSLDRSIQSLDFSDRSCRVSDRDHASWYIGGDDGARTDDRTGSDADPFENDGTGADKRVIGNFDR
jgi:hypothetical protein